MLSFTFLHGSSFRGTIPGASDTFMQACKDGPDYVCNCCNRLMYRKTVTEFSTAKYHKAPTQILAAISMPSSSYHMTAGKSWICRTCDSSLKRGLMPIQSTTAILLYIATMHARTGYGLYEVLLHHRLHHRSSIV